LCDFGVEVGGFFKVEGLGGGVSLGGELGEEALAASGEEVVDGGGLLGVALGGAALEAGGEALFELGIDAAGVAGVGLEVFLAAAEEEEVEHGFEPALGEPAGGEWAEEVVGGAEGESGGGVDAGKVVLRGHAEEDGRAEVEALAGALGAEGGGCGLVEGEEGFKLGAGKGEFDAADEGGELEAFGLSRGGGEQSADAAAEVGGTVEVRLGAVVVAEEGEDGGGGGDAGPVGVLGIEWEGVLEHRRAC
jgi:hypothetical protein